MVKKVDQWDIWLVVERCIRWQFLSNSKIERDF